MQILFSIALGLIGFATYKISYSALRNQWPQSYLGLSETFALRTIERWWRLLLFRAVPSFILTVMLVVTSWRIVASEVVVVSIATGLHLITSNGLALVRSFLPRTTDSRVNYAGYHLGAIVSVLIGTCVALFISPFAGRFVPTPDQLVTNLWLALFIAVAGGFFLGIARNERRVPFDGKYFVDRARREVGIDLQDQLFEIAILERADPVLLRSLMIAEVLQRPRWFRQLEYFKGRFRSRGSYGVMQVNASRPIDDLESIRITARELTGMWGVQVSSGMLTTNENSIWRGAGHHNGDRLPIENVMTIYQQLFFQVPWSLFVPYATFASPLRIVEARRYVDAIGLRGIAAGGSINFSWVVDGALGNSTHEKDPSDAFWAFEAKIPISADQVEISSDGTRLGVFDLSIEKLLAA